MSHHKNRASSLLLNLALLAFLVRSLVPVGFMPAQHAHDTYPLVICSGYGPVTIHVTADKLPYAPAHPAQAHDHMPCSYAQSLAHGVPLDIAALPVIQFISEEPMVWVQNLSSYFIFKSYLSQGPPLILA